MTESGEIPNLPRNALGTAGVTGGDPWGPQTRPGTPRPGDSGSERRDPCGPSPTPSCHTSRSPLPVPCHPFVSPPWHPLVPPPEPPKAPRAPRYLSGAAQARLVHGDVPGGGAQQAGALRGHRGDTGDGTRTPGMAPGMAPGTPRGHQGDTGDGTGTPWMAPGQRGDTGGTQGMAPAHQGDRDTPTRFAAGMGWGDTPGPRATSQNPVSPPRTPCHTPGHRVTPQPPHVIPRDPV